MGILDKPTLVEQFVQLIPLNYSIAALIWTMILGPPLGFLVTDIEPPLMSASVSDLAIYYNSVSLVLALFYLLYIPRYLRLRVLRAEGQILPIMPGGEEEYDSAFKLLDRRLPVIVLMIPFLTPAIGLYSPGVPIATLYNMAQFFVIAFGLANFIWEYSVINWGLHQLGRSQVKLKSFMEDRLMGAKPVGNAALSATIAYLGGLLFLALLGNSNPMINGPIFYLAVLILLVLGVALFFLPLNSLHSRMMEEKTKQQTELGQQLLMMSRPTGNNSASRWSSVATTENGIAELLRLEMLEIADRKLAGTPTWPFDVQLIARLITIILSVTTVLLARIITDFLKI